MEPSTELVNMVLRYYDAISQGDMTMLERILAHQAGTLVIGTDPNEWWMSYENIIDIYKTQLKEMGGMKVIAGKPQAYCEGTVGWAFDRPTFQMPNGAEIPFRMTTVFHREDGEWRIVQQHVSIGVPNEQALGMTLSV